MRSAAGERKATLTSVSVVTSAERVVAMPEQRPTADALLARLKEKDRARLRIWSVPRRGGKNLRCSRRRMPPRRGPTWSSDLSKRTRRDTRAQLRDLGSFLDERWSIAERRWSERTLSSIAGPRCVVDELAHTNVPGSRNAKRSRMCSRSSTRAFT